MSHRRKNIVLEGAGVRVRCKDEEVERTLVPHHILVSVPRTFGDYCRSRPSCKGSSFFGPDLTTL